MISPACYHSEGAHRSTVRACGASMRAGCLRQIFPRLRAGSVQAGVLRACVGADGQADKLTQQGTSI